MGENNFTIEEKRFAFANKLNETCTNVLSLLVAVSKCESVEEFEREYYIKRHKPDNDKADTYLILFNKKHECIFGYKIQVSGENFNFNITTKPLTPIGIRYEIPNILIKTETA